VASKKHTNKQTDKKEQLLTELLQQEKKTTKGLKIQKIERTETNPIG
jgi:hypothetical protein